jgi:hypothetical protein
MTVVKDIIGGPAIEVAGLFIFKSVSSFDFLVN